MLRRKRSCLCWACRRSVVGTTLSDVPSVCTAQVDAYARERKLQLVGYYQANEKLDDITFSATGRKIADKLQQRCPQACAVVVSENSGCLLCCGVPAASLALRCTSAPEPTHAGRQ